MFESPMADAPQGVPMSDMQASLNQLQHLEGVIAAAVVDSSSGMCLGTVGDSEGFDLEVAAAATTEVYRAQQNAIKHLELKEGIEDILVSLDNHYHLIRTVSSDKHLFLYLIMSRVGSNLALARRKLTAVEKELSI